jgi:hypothetical protein
MYRIANAIDYPAGMEAAIAGYKEIFLTTDPNNFYEKFGWTKMDDGNSPDGQVSKIYRIAVSLN